MTFAEVHASIPYMTEGETHSHAIQVYPNVRVKMPGRHAMDTDPVGGDFVVELLCNSAGWDWKQFTHSDIFKDVEEKTLFDPEFMREVAAPRFARVVSGEKIPNHTLWRSLKLPGVNYKILLQGMQCLAVAEHRRYHKYEAGGGGRFLPLRFSLGIIFGHWTAEDAAKVQRRGIHGYRELTKAGGNPPTVRALTKEVLA